MILPSLPKGRFSLGGAPRLRPVYCLFTYV